jgi:hypothetical protein
VEDVTRYLARLSDLDSGDMVVMVITGQLAEWVAALQCADPRVDAMEDSAFFDYMLKVTESITQPMVLHSVLRTRLVRLSRAVLGSRFLVDPNRMPRLIAQLPATVRRLLAEYRITCNQRLDADHKRRKEELAAKHNLRKHRLKEQLKHKKMSGSDYKNQLERSSLRYAEQRTRDEVRFSNRQGTMIQHKQRREALGSAT